MGCFKTWCLDNFPFLEEDIKALDNYHIMCKLYEYIKNIAKDVATLTTQYTTLVNGFEELKNYVDQYLEDLDGVKESIEIINNTLDSLTSQTNNNTQRIEQVNDELIQLISNNYTSLKNYIDSQVTTLDNEINNILVGQIQISDPTTGRTEDLQTVINNLYSLSNVNGLTVAEFDALELTVDGFDDYQITVFEFDTSGKLILGT